MIRFINPYFSFKDDRGLITGLIQEGNWKEINVIDSKKGTRRGDHYHKKCTELFIMLSGRVKVYLQSVDEPDRQMIITFFKGDVFIVERGTYHTFEVIDNSTWINALDMVIKDDFYKRE